MLLNRCMQEYEINSFIHSRDSIKCIKESNKLSNFYCGNCEMSSQKLPTIVKLLRELRNSSDLEAHLANELRETISISVHLVISLTECALMGIKSHCV